MKRLCAFIIIIISSSLFAQDNFPLNGIKETDQVYHAFINVDIMINPGKPKKKHYVNDFLSVVI